MIFNQQSINERSARLELNFAQNGDSKLIQSTLEFLKLPTPPPAPVAPNISNEDNDPPIPDLNNANVTNNTSAEPPS